MDLISSHDLPVPRLELRWGETTVTDGRHQRVCSYNLVVPLLNACDCRKEYEGASEDKTSYTMTLGTTIERGGKPFEALYREGVSKGTFILPMRDKRHAFWDAEVLKLPVFVVYENYAAVVTERS